MFRDSYEDLLRDNPNYVRRDESILFINDVKSRITNIFINTPDYRLQITPAKELSKKMKEELSRLRYNLNSGEVYIHTVISFYYY